MKRFSAKISFLAIFSLSAVILSFQNCSDVRLSKIAPVEQVSHSSALGSLTHLPAPKILAPNMRIVFFVDQSTSMARQRCPQELDWGELLPDEQRRGDTRNCDFEDGVDVMGDRFGLIQKWIQLFDMFGIGAGDIKFAILPFSGGIRQRPSTLLNDEVHMKFLSRTDALLYNEQLLNEHIDDVDLMKSNMGATPQYLGTSVPLPVLTYAKGMIEAEMNDLNQESKLGDTNFHFVYLSDGIFKPTHNIVQRAKDVLGCANCNTNPGHVTCQKSPPAGKTCEYNIGNQRVSGCLWQLCHEHLPALMKDNFGDPDNNDYELIKEELVRIKALENNFFEAKINFHFISLFPEETAKFPWEPNNKDWSIYNHIAEEFPEGEFVEYQGGDLEIDFKLPINQEVHFEIDNFYAINLNTYVDSFNKRIVDNDSDGIEDSLELSKGFDPQLARSNGVCLDVITDKFGCDAAITQACFAHFDYDGDGLNQCEEQILATEEKNADTDGDGVIDSHEILRGLNPNKDDHEDISSLDSVNAMDHFKKGVHPIVNLNQVQADYKIDLRISREGYEQYPGTFGNEYHSGRYKIELKNIPTKAVGPFFNDRYLSRDMILTDVYDPDQYLLGTKHQTNKNEILFLLKLRQVQKPDEKQWFMKRVEIDASSGARLNLRLDEFKTLELKEKRKAQ